MKEKEKKSTNYYENTKELIKIHSIEANQKVSGIFQRRLKTEEASCDGMLLYEEEKDGDGIKGKYYDNEQWIGVYSERKDEKIDFIWTGASPKKGINQHNFSVRWEGFLLAPYSGPYLFSVECDDGATVSMNDELILSHNLETSEKENSSRTENWMNHEIWKRSRPNENHKKSSSNPIHLVGGNKYKITVSYYHSIHDDFTESSKSYMKFLWSSDEWKEEVVPKKYLYSNNNYPPLKITEFSSEDAVVRRLLENDLAFKNSNSYILQDIPREYIGSPSLKWSTRIKSNEIKFHINAPNIVYIAYLAHYPNPLPDEFENTQQSMSILQIEGKPNKSQKKFIAKRSGMLRIFKKNYLEGKITIPLKQNGFNIKGVPLIMWFGFDPDSGGPVTCGGNEYNLSIVSGPYYAGCRASSEFLGTSCSHGLNDKMVDSWGNMWYTRGEGIGAWIEIRFKGLFLITKIDYQDRKNPLERNSRIELIFDDSSVQYYDLKNTNDLKSIRIDPVKSSSIKISIKGVYGTINNGGAFRVYGVKCTNIESKNEGLTPAQKSLAKKTGVKDTSTLPALFKNEEKETIRLKCRDSVSNTKIFKSMKKNVGNKILVYCSDTCINTDFTVYGDMFYTKDSAICKSAFHSQKLPSEGGKVWLIFENGKSSYRSQMRNGIRSEGKAKSDVTITFEGYVKKEEIIIQAGSKIDFANPSGSGWLPAVIITALTKDSISKTLTISIEGVSGEPISINYPDESKIAPCGDHVKNRNCKGSRRNLKGNKPLKIRFMPSDYSEDGDYIPDNGKKFGETGKAFGWSRDMSSRMKQFNEASKEELHTYVEFFPSPKSKLCSSPGAICEKVKWSAKVGAGVYMVRLYVGDPENESKVDLMVNDKYLAENKIIKEDDLKIYEAIIESKNEFITIKSNCKVNCDKYVSKLNAVEISPYEDEKNVKKPVSKEKQLTCGHAFTGGRCDKGPDVTHCLFNDPSAEVAGNCTGSLVIMQIPKTYHCKNQVGKYKCVKKVYKNEEECRKFCVNNCKKSQCIS